MSEAVAILGGTSSIGRALAARYASRGARVVVAGRDLPELERVAKDLTIRHGGDALAVGFDALAFETHEGLVERLDAVFPGGLDGVILVYGEQVEQEEAQRDPAALRRMFEINALSAISLLEGFAARFEERGRGFLCGITSVAADRGRPSNYLYGASKAALATALDGMRARLAKRGVRVVTVKPGFVDTPLTWGRPGVFLAARPERVARDVERAIRRNRRTLYTPPWWALVMTLIRWIPDPIFRRLSL